MNIKEISIGQVRRQIDSTSFQRRYNYLILGDTDVLTQNDLIELLKIAVIFLNYGDGNLQKLGYRIILRYSLLYNNFTPLFDVAINKGYIPISKFIEKKYFDNDSYSNSFFNLYFSSYQNNFLQGAIYLTYGQKKLINFSDSSSNNFVLVAPTSYGKSEIIINKVKDNIGKKICIIVPSKALLAQTKKRLLESTFAGDVGRIITHAEMFKGDEESFVAVLTQERLLRLLQKNTRAFVDFVLIDEAHNLLKKDTRSTLLAQVLMIILKRNPNTTMNFFSPFIVEGENLKIPHVEYNLIGEKSTEAIKVERFYVCDIKNLGHLYLYDQFFNVFNRLKKEQFSSDTDLIFSKRAKKNIVYINKPRDVVNFSLRLSSKISQLSESNFITDAIENISDFLHPDYDLIACIRKGVAYHHGGMPEIIRLYVEDIFSKNPDLHFIVTTSTLLEGVNIPAEKIFLLTTKIGPHTFSKSEFKNLIGRVCRFSEIFHPETGSLRMLEPEIYLIKSGYEAVNANQEAFLRRTAKVDIKLTDDVDNILLKPEYSLDNNEKETLLQTLEYLENIEPNTVNNEDVEYVQSDIAKLCYRNNVYDFDIKKYERQLNNNLANFSNEEKINNASDLMTAIYDIFIYSIDITKGKVERLKNLSARKFYAMILDWRTKGSSFKEMISKFTNYWSKLGDTIVYFGGSWGEIKRDYDERVPAYIDLRNKTEAQRVNLAIIKIKDEQDYIENNLLKYIEILYELDLVDSVFYDKIKYGSADQKIISLLKNGFSIELAKAVTRRAYEDLIQINTSNDEILINKMLIEQMEDNFENTILIFEIKYHIRYK